MTNKDVLSDEAVEFIELLQRERSCLPRGPLACGGCATASCPCSSRRRTVCGSVTGWCRRRPLT
jgi:hypothetical protein